MTTQAPAESTRPPAHRFGHDPFLGPNLRRAAFVLIVVALIIRIAPVLAKPDNALAECDGAPNWHLAQNLAAGKGLVITDERQQYFCPGMEPGPSHHFSPLLPAIEAGFILAMGNTVWALAASSIAITLATAVLVFACTRDLFGRDTALLVTAAVGLEWTGVVYGSWLAQAENLIIATLTVTLWAILRSLSDPRYIVWAGAAAGLGYLSKSSIGWFFLIAGLGGAAWRLFHHGWRGLANRWYLVAIVLFGVFVGAWSARNLYLFWDGTPAGLLTDWQTSEYVARATGHAFGRPAELLAALGIRAAVLAPGLLVPLALLLPRIRASLADWRNEAISAMLLATALVFAIGLVLNAVFLVFERHPLLWLNTLRYVTPAQVPLLWIASRYRAPPALAWAWGFLLAFSLFQDVWVRDHIHIDSPLFRSRWGSTP